jgi:hypothetical protein
MHFLSIDFHFKTNKTTLLYIILNVSFKILQQTCAKIYCLWLSVSKRFIEYNFLLSSWFYEGNILDIIVLYLVISAYFMIDWLFTVLRPALKNFSLVWRRRHYRWRTARFRPMLGEQGLWARRGLYRATLAVTRDLGFSGLIRRTALFSRLLRYTRGCGGSILTRILTEFLR